MTACDAGGPPVADGDTVRVHYTGTLADGSQFDSSVGKDPLEFAVGAGQMIAGFDKAVLGMKVGESKTVLIPAADAYGERRDDLAAEIPRVQLPPDTDPKIGDQLQVSTGQGPLVVTVTAVTADTVTLDANHFLAGKDLTFEIELVSINGEPAAN